MSADFSPQERQRLISMYTTQYNQTNVHINRLFNTLDDIRHNLNTLIGNNNNNNNMNNMNNNMNNNRQYRLNRPNRTTPIRESSNNSGHPHVYYDYANPIDRSTYVGDVNDNNPDITNFLSDIITNNNSNNNAHDNNPIITSFLTNFLNSVPVRPTQEQINSASRLVSYSDIQNPNSTSCAISLELFVPSDSVIQLNHCRHIFFPDQFNQWFSNNVRCPVCRHDIRNTTNNSNSNLTTNIIDQLTADLLTSVHPNTNSNDYELLFETIIRSNNV